MLIYVLTAVIGLTALIWEGSFLVKALHKKEEVKSGQIIFSGVLLMVMALLLLLVIIL